MLDEAARKALVERLLRQQWSQGSLISWQIDLFLARGDAAWTEAAERAISGGGLTLVFEEKEPGEQMIVVSQQCDIVSIAEPFIEAIPLVVWQEGRGLPVSNSSRYFVVDRDRRLVADASRRLLFEKTLVPDADAQQAWDDESRVRSFAAWCARRYSRVAWADALVATVGAALQGAIERAGKNDSAVLEAVHSWRLHVTGATEGEGWDVWVLVPYDERASSESVDAFVAAVAEEANKAVPDLYEKVLEKARQDNADASLDRYNLAGITAAPTSQVSLKDVLQFKPLNLEHMTYSKEAVVGVEPHEEVVA